MDYQKFQKKTEEEQNQVYNLYREDKPFVPYLRGLGRNFLYQSGLQNEILGRGGYGTVYTFGRDYVVKSIRENNFETTEQQDRDIETLSLGSTRKKWLEDVLERLHLKGQVSPSQIVDNDGDGYDLREVMSKQSSIEVNIKDINEVNCQVTEPYDITSQGQTLSIERGDYVCLNNAYREFLIGLYLNKVVNSIHFIKTLGFESDNGLDNIYFSRADRDFKSLINLSNDDFNIYLFIILGHIFIMTSLGIAHNDLSISNILLKKNPYTQKYFEYRLFGHSFYFRAPSDIILIADFGLSQKFTSPKILSYDLIHENFETIPAFNTKGIYDLFLFLCSLNQRIPQGKHIFKRLFGDYLKFQSRDQCRLIPETFPQWGIFTLDIEFFKEFFQYNLHRPEDAENNIILATEFP